MQPRVFIPQETQRRDKNTGAWRPVVNLKPALEFGNLIHMTDGKSGTLDVPQMVKDMTSALMGFHEGWDGRPGNPDAVAFNDNDFLVLVGGPTAIGIAVALASEINDGRVKILAWDNKNFFYTIVPVDVLADPIFNQE